MHCSMNAIILTCKNNTSVWRYIPNLEKIGKNDNTSVMFSKLDHHMSCCTKNSQFYHLLKTFFCGILSGIWRTEIQLQPTSPSPQGLCHLPLATWLLPGTIPLWERGPLIDGCGLTLLGSLSFPQPVNRCITSSSRCNLVSHNTHIHTKTPLSEPS